jgi:hypothetical protein
MTVCYLWVTVLQLTCSGCEVCMMQVLTKSWACAYSPFVNVWCVLKCVRSSLGVKEVVAWWTNVPVSIAQLRQPKHQAADDRCCQF